MSLAFPLRVKRPSPAGPRFSERIQPSAMWLFFVLIMQVFCQLGLLIEILAPFRVFFRSGAYAASILALVAAYGTTRKPHHLSFWAGAICLICIAVEFMHPDTNTAVSAIATLGLYTAVMAPLFWVPRLDLNLNTLKAVILFMWGFHSLSAFFGVLQVYFPGEYQPAVSVSVLDSRWGGENLKVALVGGEQIYRPMGLTDMPGGAAYAGLYAFVLGMGLFALKSDSFVGWLGLFTMPLGLFCIYLCQVRVTLVLAAIIAFVFSVALFATRRFAPAVRVSFIVPVVGSGAFIWAVAMGGEATSARFETLIAENPDEVYQKNRGHFLISTFEEMLPDYPLGAGLGRWGMIHSYFGDNSIDGSHAIWVEIQLTAWLLDGGVILIVSYSMALLLAIWMILRVGFNRDHGELAAWALLILAYDVAILALTFSYAPFIGAAGMEFWLLNALTGAVAQQYAMRRSPAP